MLDDNEAIQTRIAECGSIDQVLNVLHPDFQYRPQQKEMILEIIGHIMSGTKYIVLNAATGCGKSFIAKHVMEVIYHITGKKSCLLTKTISLQEQYLEDFKDLSLLKSASNYPCNSMVPSPIPPSRKSHKDCNTTKENCHYERAKNRFRSSEFKILNYAFYMHGLSVYGSGETHQVLVADEAHNLELSLLDKCTVELDRSFILSELDHKLEKSISVEEAVILKHKIDIKILTIKSQIANIEQRIDSMMEGGDSISNSIIEAVKTQLDPLMELSSSLGSVSFGLHLYTSDEKRDRWVMESDSDSIYLKPVFIPKVFFDMVFTNMDHVILMSATAERIVSDLGIEDESAIVSGDYIFDTAKRPIYAITSLPKFNAGSRLEVLPNYSALVDQIISQYSEDTNVLIHSISYANAEYLRDNSEHSSRILIPNKQQVRDIKRVAGNGKIIISPSMLEGVDMAEGLAKVQIFIKNPYPYLGDPFIKLKNEMDEGWYDYQTLQAIIQGSGRGIRSITDSADTFILDPSFKWLLQRNDKLVPSWWKDTIQFIG